MLTAFLKGTGLSVCLNILESSYFAFKGQFDLGASINLFVFKAGINWVFQVTMGQQ